LAGRFQFLNQGDGSTPGRQRTLNATLDWSYQLLTEHERILLERLSLFAGSFDLEAATTIGAVGAIGRHDVVDALDNLIAKSLVSVSRDALAPYRLLEATRAYGREKLVERGEFAECAEKHAEYFRDQLKQAELELQEAASSDWLNRYRRKIDDVRAALGWAFSTRSSEALGVSIVVEAIPLWSRMSLLEECRAWVERVLSSTTLRSEIADRDNMVLYAALGAASFYTRGADPEVKVALSKALRFAESLGNTTYLMRVLWKLAYYSLYIGKHSVSLELATRLRNIAQAVGDTAGKRDGDRTAAAALHYMGDHVQARRLLDPYIDDELILAEGPRLARFQLDHRVALHTTQAHILFVQGFADQAVQNAEIAVNEAIEVGHPLSLGSVLVLSAVPISLYRGDISEAERLLAMLMDLVAKHGLVLWSAMTDCLHGALLILKGEAAGVSSLRRATDSLRAVNFGARHPAFLGLLAQGLGAIGKLDEALLVIEAALRWSKQHQELWFFPELMRIKGELIGLDGSPTSRDAAEKQLMQAVELARKQHALSWELRAGIDLAKLWHGKRQTVRARRLLATVYGRFREGFETADMRAARVLLEKFAPAPGL
jgi:predicted ATPase